MRPWLALPTFVLVAVAARPAAGATALNGGVIKLELFVPKDNGANGTAQSTSEDKFVSVGDNLADSSVLKDYVNGARCECDRKDPDNDAAATAQRVLIKVRYAANMTPMPDPGDIGLTLYAGDHCDEASADPTVVGKRCSKVEAFSAITLRSNAVQNVFARVGDLLAAGTVEGTAPGTANPCNVEDNSVEVTVVSGTSTVFNESTTLTVPFDLKPPTMPVDLTARGLDQAIRIEWDAPADPPDYYQALCIRADGKPAHSLEGAATPNATTTALFDSTQSLCMVAPAVPEDATDTEDDSAAVPLPMPLTILDPNYVCGQAAGSAASIDLTGLDNDVDYRVVVLAIDEARNYTARAFPHPIHPIPSIDFWEDLNQEDPNVDGGFCVSQVGTDGSAASALLVLGAIGLVVRRRRRTRGQAARTAALLTLGLVVLAPTVARAQSWDPYWVDSEASATNREDLPQWHLGLRVGPYHPAVDENFGSDPGPFRRMFGPGYNLVPQLDLHRIWTVSTLQVGVGVSGGYYQKSADAYMIGTSPDDPDRPRSPGSTNTFKMIPLSVSGLARLTVLDDRWGVPLVPYLRGGVAYNVWWVRTATGDLAVTDCQTCDDKALGASAGLVGAVGLSIRGERIDAEASHSMKNGGVEHAGFYVELEQSWVDGFGNERRLSLGDKTWYAGVDFEF